MSKIEFLPSQYKKAFDPKEGGLFKTPAALLSMGMCVCDHCGNLSSVDYRQCSRCGEEILIVQAKSRPKP